MDKEWGKVNADRERRRYAREFKVEAVVNVRSESGVRISHNGKLPFGLNSWAMAGDASTPAAYFARSKRWLRPNGERSATSACMTAEGCEQTSSPAVSSKARAIDRHNGASLKKTAFAAGTQAASAGLREANLSGSAMALDIDQNRPLVPPPSTEIAVPWI